MDYRKEHFKGQLEGEQLICFFRQHWITLLSHWGILAVVLITSFLTVFNLNIIIDALRDHPLIRAFFFIGYLTAFLFSHLFFVRFLNYFLCTTLVTDQRIIEHKTSLFITDVVEIIQMNQIQDIEHNLRGILPNILRYGKIRIVLASSTNTKEIMYVPDGKFYFRIICKLRDEKNKLYERFIQKPIVFNGVPELPQAITSNPPRQQYSSVKNARR